MAGALIPGLGLNGLGLGMPGIGGWGAALNDWEDDPMSMPLQQYTILVNAYQRGYIDALTFNAQLDAWLRRRGRTRRRRGFRIQGGFGGGFGNIDGLGGLAALGGGLGGGFGLGGGGDGMGWGGGWAGGLGGFAAYPTPYQLLPQFWNSWY